MNSIYKTVRYYCPFCCFPNIDLLKTSKTNVAKCVRCKKDLLVTVLEHGNVKNVRKLEAKNADI